MSKPLTFQFSDDGIVPNNPLAGRSSMRARCDLSAAAIRQAAIEALFKLERLGPRHVAQRRLPFVHYHPMIHEALGIARGHGRFAARRPPAARRFDLKAGDVAVLPAGTGHQRLSASDDFLVIGGYPPEGDLQSLPRRQSRRYVTRPCRRSRRCRCRRAIRCSARAAGSAPISGRALMDWISFYDFKHSVIYVNARHRDVHYRTIADRHPRATCPRRTRACSITAAARRPRRDLLADAGGPSHLGRGGAERARRARRRATPAIPKSP